MASYVNIARLNSRSWTMEEREVHKDCMPIQLSGQLKYALMHKSLMNGIDSYWPLPSNGCTD